MFTKPESVSDDFRATLQKISEGKSISEEARSGPTPDWLEYCKHRDNGKAAVERGEYDTARKHFLKADIVDLKMNPRANREMGWDHNSSDRALHSKHKYYHPHSFDRQFDSLKLSDKKHDNKLKHILD